MKKKPFIRIIVLLAVVFLVLNACISIEENSGTPPIQQEIPNQITSQIPSEQINDQNSLLYGSWFNENTLISNFIIFVEPNILYEEGGTAIVGRQSFTYSFNGRILTISQGNNDYAHAPVALNGDTLTIGPFEGDNDWHYNLFLWGTFTKAQG